MAQRLGQMALDGGQRHAQAFGDQRAGQSFQLRQQANEELSY